MNQNYANGRVWTSVCTREDGSVSGGVTYSGSQIHLILSTLRLAPQRVVQRLGALTSLGSMIETQNLQGPPQTHRIRIYSVTTSPLQTEEHAEGRVFSPRKRVYAIRGTRVRQSLRGRYPTPEAVKCVIYLKCVVVAEL